VSATLLTRVHDHIDDAGLITGYAVRYFRWTDADLAGNTPIIMFRQSGSGASDELLQNTRVSIVLLANPTGVVAADTRAQAIQRLLRGDTVPTGIVRFDPVGAVRGPLMLENGRQAFEVIVACYTEDQ